MCRRCVTLDCFIGATIGYSQMDVFLVFFTLNFYLRPPLLRLITMKLVSQIEAQSARVFIPTLTKLLRIVRPQVTIISNDHTLHKTLHILEQIEQSNL